MSRARQWSDLSTGQRAVVVVGATVEVALTAVAVRDLRHRPQDQIRGPKPLWWLAVFVQPAGPIAYLTWARRPRG